MEEWIHVKKLPPHDKIDWIRIIAVIRENASGEIRERETDGILDENGPSIFIWEDGNYSCDCNRYLFFTYGDEDDELREVKELLLGDDGAECGHERYSVNLKNPVTGKIFYQEF